MEGLRLTVVFYARRRLLPTGAEGVGVCGGLRVEGLGFRV